MPVYYSAGEDDGSIVFMIEVINGGLSSGLQLVVEFHTEEGTALGWCN